MSSSFNIPRFCFVMNIQQSIHFPSDIEKRPKRNSLGRISHPCYHLNSENSLCTHVNTGNHNDYPILLPCNVGTDVEVYSDHVTVKAFFQKHDQPFIFSVHCSEATSINPSRKLTPPVFSLSFRYLCTPPRHCISQNCFIEYFYIL